MSGYTQGRRDGYEAAVDALLPYYSAALDEVHRLRRALAREARIVEAHLDLKSFPKSRRVFAEEQVQRMRQSARGAAQLAYAGVDYQVMDGCMRMAGAASTLTRDQWEREVDRVSGGSGASGETPNG